MKRAFLMLGLGLALCSCVEAMTAAELLKDCTVLSAYGDKPMSVVPPLDVVSYGECLGIMYAVTDALHGLLMHPDNGGIYTIQIATAPDGAQPIDVFIKYINEHPEERNSNAITCLINALSAKGILQMKLFDMSKSGPTDWFKKQKEKQ